MKKMKMLAANQAINADEHEATEQTENCGNPGNQPGAEVPVPRASRFVAVIPFCSFRLRSANLLLSVPSVLSCSIPPLPAPCSVDQEKLIILLALFQVATCEMSAKQHDSNNLCP
jgi:hypothetical protein